jgi:imidazolonepropionase-like amidohydrolase
MIGWGAILKSGGGTKRGKVSTIYRLCTALVPIAVVGCGYGGTRIPENALVVRNGAIIDGTGGPPIADGAVVVQGERIVAVGEAATFQIPEDARVVDADGGSILPGVINSHTHSTHDPAVRRAFLTDGVTTVCNLGTSLDRLPLFDEASVPEGPAARGYWAGSIITAPGGYPGPVYGSQFSYEVGSPEEARAAVTDLLDRGASMIKIALAPGDPRNPWPVLDLARVQAIVEQAHARGALVRAHVFEPYLVEGIVLPAGVDVIEHEPFPILTPEEESLVLGSNEPLTLLFDVVAPEFERLLERMIGQGTVMVPTLDQRVGTLFNKPDRSPVEQIVVDVHVEAARRFHALGGALALGNDFGGVPHVQPGMPLVEMELFLAARLTPMEVIEASTRHAAFVCGHGDSLGTLEPGKLADIIIVDGDPLTDLAAMDNVIAVIKGGELAHRDH